MFDELLDLYDDYVTHNKFADNYFINRVFTIINKYHYLGEYLKNVYVTKNKSEYLSFEKAINIGLNEIYVLTNGLKKELNEDYVYYFNLFVMETIFHELEHVFQEEKMEKGPDDIERHLLILSDPSILFSTFYDNKNIINYIKVKIQAKRQNRYYIRNHDLAPFERIANLRSLERTCLLIDGYSIANMGIDFYNMSAIHTTNRLLVKGYVLRGDKTNSPSLDYLKEMKGVDNKSLITYHGFHDNSISFENRLLYGLELSRNEYNDLLDKINVHK